MQRLVNTKDPKVRQAFITTLTRLTTPFRQGYVPPSALNWGDPYWLDPKDPHRPPAVRQGVLGPTLTWFYVYNPAYAQCDAEHIFSVAESNIINGMAQDQATDKVFARMEQIFADYPIPHQA